MLLSLVEFPAFVRFLPNRVGPIGWVAMLKAEKTSYVASQLVIILHCTTKLKIYSDVFSAVCNPFSPILALTLETPPLISC
jgi:hypothetical protein